MKWKGAREEAFWQLDSVYSSGFRLSTRFWNLTAGIFFYHSATRASERSSTDVG